MHEPVKYYLDDSKTRLLVDCKGGPNAHPINPAVMTDKEQKIFEDLKAKNAPATVEAGKATETTVLKNTPATQPAGVIPESAPLAVPQPGMDPEDLDKLLYSLKQATKPQMLSLIKASALPVEAPVGITNVELRDAIAKALIVKYAPVTAEAAEPTPETETPEEAPEGTPEE